MAEQHRATPQQWLELLELLNRIEALEAKDEDDKEAWAAMRRARSSQAERIASLVKRIEDLEATDSKWASIKARAVLEVAQSAESNHPEKPDSSLVERVAFAITGDSDGPINWKPEARAAIREVAAWLQEQSRYGVSLAWVVERLEEEAER